MKTIAIIPARMRSSRLPGKPLIEVKGKPIIQYVWENIQSPNIDLKIIATDDQEIVDTVNTFGGNAVLTSIHHQNGSERCAEILSMFPDFEIVLNIQGDEPMVNTKIISALIDPFINNPNIEITTLKAPIDKLHANNKNIVKVVTDKNNFALYFSRSMIPYERDLDNHNIAYFKHLGFYAFKKSSLLEYVRLTPTRLEEIEKLEQLRLLENGKKIFVNECKEKLIDINTQEDVETFRELLDCHSNNSR